MSVMTMHVSVGFSKDFFCALSATWHEQWEERIIVGRQTTQHSWQYGAQNAMYVTQLLTFSCYNKCIISYLICQADLHGLNMLPNITT